jgi:hypothetical protein
MQQPLLTKDQEKYFELVQKLDPSPEMQRSVERSIERLRGQTADAKIVRGVSRVQGFRTTEH